MAVEFLPANRLTLLRSGVEYFPALEAAIREARREHAWRVSHPVPPHVERAGSQRAALAVRDNLRHRRDIEEAYLAAIASAQEEIVIASAYFFPGRRFRRALVGAAARRVRVAV